MSGSISVRSGCGKKEVVMSMMENSFDVRDYGARGDGVSLDTKAIQKAIDACSADGGGMVFVPSGDYPIGTVVMKDNTNLCLSAGARILGTSNFRDYDPPSMIYAEDAHNIALTGQGVIDGRGKEVRPRAVKEVPHNFLDGTYDRYFITSFLRCQHISLSALTMRDSPFFAAYLRECCDIMVEGIKIDNHVNVNNDGLDFDSCQNVFVSNCYISSGDDAIALKTNTPRPCKNIAVTNCMLSSRWAAFRFGPESKGNFEDIVVSNCVIKDTYGCGIKLQMVEGAQMKNIVFSNLVMDNVTGPISMRLGNWTKGLPQSGGFGTRKGNVGRPIGALQNVLFSNIRACVALEPRTPYFNDAERRSCISITGLPGHYIEGITLSGIHITFPGGGTAEEAARRAVPDMRDTYPEYFMFGVLPAYGLYAHHAKDLKLRNVRFDLASADVRPAIVCDDVQDLELSDFRVAGEQESESLIRLQQTRQAFIHGSRPLNKTGTFLRVEGLESRNIGLAGNGLRRANKILELGEGASETAVEALWNLGMKCESS
jgi:hypothetical protein